MDGQFGRFTINLMIVGFIIVAVWLLGAVDAGGPPLYNLIQHQEPLLLAISIFNETDHLLQSTNHHLVYSPQQQEIHTQLQLFAHPHIGNYSIRAQLLQPDTNRVLFTATKTLKNEADQALMMEFGAMGEQEDESTVYGLHIPTRFSVLVVHLTDPIARSSMHTYGSLFNFGSVRKEGVLWYIPPVDLSQLMVPYKSYRAVRGLASGPYNLTISITVYPMSYYSTFFLMFSRPDLMMQNNPLMPSMNDGIMDMVKETVFTNNIYLVSAFFVLSFVQMFMDIFAFRGEIAAWKKVEQKGGLSIKALYQQLAYELIVLLYLIDHNSYTFVVVISALGMVLTLWKITKAVQITARDRFPYLTVGYKSWYRKREDGIDSMAVQYTSYLTTALFAIFLVFKVYSFWSSESEFRIPSPREGYSLVLNLSVGFIMVFGFVMMTPQLYINYRLKSVDHLPWKTLIYRFISTLIGDIMVFIIDLPTMVRVFSFRDDIVFLLYLYQRWIYKVDGSRIAHFDMDVMPLKSEVGPKQE